jgi:hypothetical protein
VSPVNFDAANCVLKAPPGMDNCVDLPFCWHEHEGLVVATSCWELTEDELARIVESRRIMVQVCGNTFPPMRLAVPPKGMI